MIRFEVLGGFRVVVDGEDRTPHRWPTGRAADLAKLLALQPEARMPRDAVADALWPELPTEAGLANLHKAAHHARRALDDPGAVLLRGGTVALFPEHAVTTDLAELTAMASDSPAEHDPASVAAFLDRAGGELLPDDRYATWTAGARRMAAEARRTLLGRAGRWEEVVAIDPLDEQAQREHIASLASSGRRHAAIQAFGQLRALLMSELGVEPAVETQELYERLVGQAGPRGDVKLLGRDVELLRLRGGWQEGRRHPLTWILLRGEAGMGKSTVADHLAGTLAEGAGWDGAVIDLVGLADARPYAGLRRVLAELGVAPRHLEGEAARVLASLGDTDSPHNRQEVLDAFDRGLDQRLQRPTLLVLDDADHADAASLDLLPSIRTGGGGVPLVVALAHPPQQQARPSSACDPRCWPDPGWPRSSWVRSWTSRPTASSSTTRPMLLPRCAPRWRRSRAATRRCSRDWPTTLQ